MLNSEPLPLWPAVGLRGDSPVFALPFHFGAWLQAQREARGLTRRRLQMLTGIHRSKIAWIEVGRRSPGRRTRRHLIEFFSRRLGDHFDF